MLRKHLQKEDTSVDKKQACNGQMLWFDEFTFSNNSHVSLQGIFHTLGEPPRKLQKCSDEFTISPTLSNKTKLSFQERALERSQCGDGWRKF